MHKLKYEILIIWCWVVVTEYGWIDNSMSKAISIKCDNINILNIILYIIGYIIYATEDTFKQVE